MLSSKQITQFQKNLTNLPLIALLVANALPVVGVLCLGWDAFAIVLLYWSENVVVGFYNILKMAFMKVDHPVEHLGKLFMIPFFTVHYGMFTMVHGIFVRAFFSDDFSGNPLELGLHLPFSMYMAFACLFVSHGISFVNNYFLKGERSRTNLGKLMGQPYGRIVVLHVAIIFGGFLTMTMGSPVGVLLILVLLKTIIDVKLHLRERKKNKTVE
ncbi:MAG: DUF6498-containing protein [Planctomycetota bacterium]|jgi:hypothetical protein